MAGSRDVQFLELKDTINQLNTTIRNQNDLIASLNKRLEEQAAKEEKKDQLIANLTAQLEFLKQKLFGSTSEAHKGQLAGQLSLFDNPESDEQDVF